MRRLGARWVPLVGGVVVALASGCGVDDQLTCGAACDPNAHDARAPSDAADGASDQAAAEAADGCAVACPQGPGGCCQPGESCVSTGCCAGSAGHCRQNSDCCSPLVCGSSRRCEATCQTMGMTCTTNPDTCCVGTYCNAGMCVMCKGNGQTCSQDTECCQGGCDGMMCGG